MNQPWTIPGSDGQPILGDAHLPDEAPRGAVLLAHGFKGYKDYGMFPRIATALADAGFIAHRFNFSHSGMTNNIETFERPDLFERDTWNRQVHDYRAVIEALASGAIAGQGLPHVMFGHSRGGVTALLAAGRFADDATLPQPSGVATASAPSGATMLSEEDSKRLLREGSVESASARTGQTLRIGSAYLQEQLDDPAGHDVPALAKRIRRPVLIMHGRDDPTVPADHAHRLARAIGDRARLEIIDGADHVFNTPNPMDPGAAPSAQLATLVNVLLEFAEDVCASGPGTRDSGSRTGRG